MEKNPRDILQDQPNFHLQLLRHIIDKTCQSFAFLLENLTEDRHNIFVSKGVQPLIKKGKNKNTAYSQSLKPPGRSGQ